MKYTDLKIQTQREFPNNARTAGFGWLVRAGYLTRENELLPLGEQALAKVRELSIDPAFLFHLSLPVMYNETDIYFPLSSGNMQIAHCDSCKYTERLELAQFKKPPFSKEGELPLEKVLTPDCHTIEALANFLDIPKEKTAKALMYTRAADNKFVFVVVRGDMTLSEAKLRKAVGDVKLADEVSIRRSGAEAGFASPIGLKDTLIVVDTLIPHSPNLVAGANEAEYHLKNTNHGRDYTAGIVADLVQAQEGDKCVKCGKPLSILPAINLAGGGGVDFENILLALAETHHDDKGLSLPLSASPFDVYLMHLTGKTVNTLEKAEEIYIALQNAGISALFDERDERAGVKFNDADLIGCPLRITVGEKGLKDGLIELKLRTAAGGSALPLEKILNLKSISELL